MSVARITEISAESGRNFDDAIRQGIRRANQTLRNVKGAWIKEQQIEVDATGKISVYRVNMLVTFVLEDSSPAGRRAAAAAASPAPKAPARKAPARKPAARRRTTRRR
jgi:flavin-binding protein dodecin